MARTWNDRRKLYRAVGSLRFRMSRDATAERHHGEWGGIILLR